MYESLLEMNRGLARSWFGERHGRTVSQVIGSTIDRGFGLGSGTGKVLFHGVLVIGILVVGVGALRTLAK